MAKALVVCATRSGETRQIGELIAEGLRISNVETKVVNANNIKTDMDIKGYDALVFGSATYHGDMMESMKKLLFLAEKAGLQGKVGGAFGAFGWSGEAPDRIFDTMQHVLKMNMVGGALRLKSSTIGGGVQMAQNYGREIAKKLTP